jgi:hypothetical protein
VDLEEFGKLRKRALRTESALIGQWGQLLFAATPRPKYAVLYGIDTRELEPGSASGESVISMIALPCILA